MKQCLFVFLNFFMFLFCFMQPALAISEQTHRDKPLKILHLTFHKGCAKEIDSIAKTFGFDLETWVIPDLPAKFFDGVTQGNALYNIGHERAARIWNLHKEKFEQFDAIITSDTAPLARIFLQNGFTKPLIIWICCRFDYSDQESLDCDFPDPEFYQLFREARLKENVTVVAYTAFEHYYAQKKGVDTGALLITPCAPIPSLLRGHSSIPSHINKEETFFLPPYWNETSFLDLSALCTSFDIPNYCGRYNGPADLKDFKGIIHLPYAWSNLAFFENIALGLPYFIPSPAFLKQLIQQSNYWHTNPGCIIDEDRFDLSEWYQSDRAGIITYFDSWEDLKHKITTTDYPVLKQRIQEYAEKHQSIMLEKWAQIFNKI